MGAHTFHGCFRDKRYAGRPDTQANELREEQSTSFPAASFFSFTLTPSRRIAPCKRRHDDESAPALLFSSALRRARLFANPPQCLRRQFRRNVSTLSRLVPTSSMRCVRFFLHPFAVSDDTVTEYVHSHQNYVTRCTS